MKITKELLTKYGQGNCTPDEIFEVEQWLASSKDDAQLSRDDLGDSIDNIRQRLKNSIFEGKDQVRPIPLHRRVIRYAAAAMILLTIGILSYWAISDTASWQRAEQMSYQTIETQRGAKRTVNLSDGSSIRMNYETQVKVPESFTGGQRIVHLSGHAHFDVAEDPKRPFIILTEDTRTEVLGTSFDINTHKAGQTEVIVSSGKVAFSNRAEKERLVTLNPNDRAVLVNENILTDQVDATTRTAWKDDRLLFDGATLEEIIEVLEPWFDVNISVENKEVLNSVFTMASDNPSLEVFLLELSFAGDFAYEVQGQQVTIF